MQPAQIKQVASAIGDVKDEIARRLRTGSEVVLLVPHDNKGNPNYAGTIDEKRSRDSLQSLIPDGVDKAAVFERVIGVGPQDGNQAFAVTPEPRGKATAYRILAA